MKKIILSLLILTAAEFFGGCSATGKRVRDLPPDDKQFLSEVRYLISKKEKELFLNTPAAEREAFIAEFWKKRDPDPTTEENEYRDEYYNRIEQSNRLFREGNSKSGWLTDRGRVYVLLGPPERRLTYPMGYDMYSRPSEVWYYGYFPIVFIDDSFVGVYKLEPLSVQQISMLNSFQMQLKPKVDVSGREVFDFLMRIEAKAEKGASLLLQLPHKVIRLTQNRETGAYETQLRVSLIILDDRDQKVLEKKLVSAVSVTEEMLPDLPPDHIIELPLELAPGSYTALATLVNETDKSEVSKKLKFKIQLRSNQ